jgi:hypothetical protein
MADILISRQDYRDAAQVAASAPAQLNGWEPNTFTGALTGTSISANGSATIPADFKDHKTVFVVTAAAAANVTFAAGNTYGARAVTKEAPAGTSLIWLDSTKFADKTSGKITVSSDKAIAIFGYEMR